MSTIDVCKIQEAQLATARDKLLQSVGSIIDNLRGIAGNIIEIAEDAQELSGVNTQDEDSFFVKMEGHLGDVSSGLRQYGSANQDLSLLMRSVAPAIEDMALCLRDIKGIEIAIERIALNACIKAAHLGEEGAGLGVLAEGIQRLVGDTRQQTLSVSQKLESIIATAHDLNISDSSDEGESDLEVSLLINDIGTILQSLRTLNEDAHANLNLVKEKGSLLSDDLQRSCSGIDVHERAAALINHILADLHQLSGEVDAQIVLKGLEETGHLEADMLENHYTMQAERLVHVSIASPPLSLEPEAVSLKVQSDAGSADEDQKENETDLGDNVELF